jgi:hypothetical protein
MKLSVAKYTRYAGLGAAASNPDQSLLDDMRKRRARLCPPECSAREVAVGGRCVVRNCPAGEKLSRSGACLRPARPTRAAEVTRPRHVRERVAKPSGGHCFAFNGAQYCE